MIEINNSKFCEHCFSKLTNNSECIECINIEEKNGHPYSLSEGTVLQGKIIVGKLLFYDNSYFGYVGFDTETNSRVLIRELFPGGFHCIRENNNLVFVNVEDECDLRAIFSKMKNDFCTEVNHMIQMDNDKVVSKVQSLFSENNTVYSIVDFPEKSMLLSDLIEKRGGKVKENTAIEIIKKAVVALDKIHSKGIIHGNICPENIIVSGNEILFTGFNHGSFKYINQTTAADYRIGKYAPLEAVNAVSAVDKRSDIYSLGATIYYAITGINIPHCVTRITSDDEKVGMQGISPKLAAIINKMIALKPADRYKDVYTLSCALNSAGLAKTKISSQKKKASAKGKIIVTVLVTLAVIIAAGLAAVSGVYLFKKMKTLDLFKKDEQVVSSSGDDNATENSENNEENGKNSEEPDMPENNGDESDGQNTFSGDPQNEDGKNKSDNEDAENNPDSITENDKENQPVMLPKPDTQNPGDNSVHNSLAKNWKVNIMLDTSNFSEYDNSVLGNKKFKRSQIVSVTVQSDLEGMTDNCWDISFNSDGSVMAWLTPAGKKGYNLYLGAEGGINAEHAAEKLFYDYVNVESITFNGNLHTDFATSTSFMFYNCKSLKSLYLDGIDTSSVTDMSHMFENCHVAKSITLTDSFSTKKVTTMTEMFDGCFNITELDLSMFNTFAVKNMSSMFYKCYKLKALNLSGFNTFSVSTMTKMFEDCTELTTLDISNFSVKGTTSISDMFLNCNKLTEISVKDEYIKNEYNKAV